MGRLFVCSKIPPKFCDMTSSLFFLTLILVSAFATLFILGQMPNISVVDLSSSLNRLHRKKWIVYLPDVKIYQNGHPKLRNKEQPMVNSVTDKSLYPTTMAIHPPAVLLRWKGGVGNQLFLYACHYALARKHDWPLYIMVDSKFDPRNRKWAATGRDFALDQFNIPFHPWNTANENWTIHDAVGITDSMLLTGTYPLDKVIQLNGNEYCQGQAFFTSYEQEIANLLEQAGKVVEEGKVNEWTDLIDGAQESVAVHVRRGDTLRLNDSAPLSFQAECMERLSKRIAQKNNSQVPPTFFIFSDDIEFVRKNMVPPNGSLIHYVSDPKELRSLEEFYLMRKCRHHINSPSSFSWWATFLSNGTDNGKLVYAGHHRKSTIAAFRGSAESSYYVWMYNHFYYPSNWIVIDPWKEEL